MLPALFFKSINFLIQGFAKLSPQTLQKRAEEHKIGLKKQAKITAIFLNQESKKSKLPYVVPMLCPIHSCFVYLIVLFFFRKVAVLRCVSYTMRQFASKDTKKSRIISQSQ